MHAWIDHRLCKLLYDNSMIEVMEVVKSYRLKVNRVGEEYNVPRTISKDRLAGRVKYGLKSGLDP